MADLNAVVIPEQGHYTAQVLEYDIAVQGKTLREIRRNLVLAVGVFLATAKRTGKPAFRGLDRAPKFYWDLLPGATDLGSVSMPAPLDETAQEPAIILRAA